jgi:hypothetical protein
MTPPRLSDYLLRWEQARDAGRDLSVEQLCPDDPELAGRLRCALELLKPLFETSRPRSVSLAATEPQLDLPADGSPPQLLLPVTDPETQLPPVEPPPARSELSSESTPWLVLPTMASMALGEPQPSRAAASLPVSAPRKDPPPPPPDPPRNRERGRIELVWAMVGMMVVVWLAVFSALQWWSATTAFSQANRAKEERDQAVSLLDRSLAALVADGKTGRIESLLHDHLTEQQRLDPTGWRTFHARSLLGVALLDQKKFADAEPLLLDGYEGLKAHHAAIPSAQSEVVSAALDRLILLYERSDNPKEAARWQKEKETQFPTK